MSIAGNYTFASLTAFQTSGTSYSNYSQNFGTPYVQQNNPNLGFYAQDEWKPSPLLTLNVGIRYDLQFLKTVNTDTNNISPRIGFAWSPFQNQRTVVRGSFGLFYDRVPLRALANALLSAGNTTDPAQGRLLQYSYVPTDPGAPTFPNVSATPNPGSKISYALMNRDIQNAYSEQASMGIEQQVFKTSTLGISYQHTRGLHLLSSYNSNINPDGTRPDNSRGNVKPYDSPVSILTMTASPSPSWSGQCHGGLPGSPTHGRRPSTMLESSFSALPINNFDFSVDRGRSDDDQRNRLVFDTNLNSPTSHANSVADHITHGWRLGGIVQYYSRLPFNITTGGQTRQQNNAASLHWRTQSGNERWHQSVHGRSSRSCDWPQRWHRLRLFHPQCSSEPELRSHRARKVGRHS